MFCVTFRQWSFKCKCNMLKAVVCCGTLYLQYPTLDIQTFFTSWRKRKAAPWDDINFRF